MFVFSFTSKENKEKSEFFQNSSFISKFTYCMSYLAKHDSSNYLLKFNRDKIKANWSLNDAFRDTGSVIIAWMEQP